MRVSALRQRLVDLPDDMEIVFLDSDGVEYMADGLVPDTRMNCLYVCEDVDIADVAVDDIWEDYVAQELEEDEEEDECEDTCALPDVGENDKDAWQEA